MRGAWRQCSGVQGLEDGVRAACSGVKTVLRWRCGGVEAFCLRVGAVQGRREHAVKAAGGRRCGGVAAVWGRPSGGVEAAFQQRSRSRLSTRRRPDGHPAPAGRCTGYCTRDTLGLAPPICDRLHGYRYRPATAERRACGHLWTPSPQSLAPRFDFEITPAKLQ